MFKHINDDNWLLFAQHNYDNPTLEREVEFYEDLKRFKYLKRLFRKYVSTKEINVRLVLNHVIVLTNVFGVEAGVTLLLYKLEKRYWSGLKAILEYLNLLYPHELREIKTDDNIKRVLKEL